MSANLYDLLASRFPKDRSKPCFLPSDGAAISYGALEAGAAQVAGRLVAEGAKVALCARRPEILNAFAEELRKSGGDVLPVVADATKPGDMERLIDETLDFRRDQHANLVAAGFLEGPRRHLHRQIVDRQRRTDRAVDGIFRRGGFRRDGG